MVPTANIDLRKGGRLRPGPSRSAISGVRQVTQPMNVLSLRRVSPALGGWPFLKKERDMSNLINELGFDELEAVCGGARNLANDPGFHPTYQTSWSNNGSSSPLFGNSSFKDTIDNNDNLP